MCARTPSRPSSGRESRVGAGRILSPVEIGRVERAFAEIAEKGEGEERAFAEQARVVFLTVVSAGLRRGEILGLRWRDVSLADPAGATLRVRETWVRGAPDTPKSEKCERTIALGERLASELFDHRARTAYQGDDERVFCNPLTGRPLDPKRYAATLRLALKRAKVDGKLRPFHDGRDTSITNAAAAGTSPAALMARAGHSDSRRGCSGRSWARSSEPVASCENGKARPCGPFRYRGGRTRTCNPRFWRPVLCQLSYAPRRFETTIVSRPFRHPSTRCDRPRNVARSAPFSCCSRSPSPESRLRRQTRRAEKRGSW